MIFSPHFEKMEKNKFIKIEMQYDDKTVKAELRREVSVDEMLDMLLLILSDITGSKELVNESVENYYETFIKKEND